MIRPATYIEVTHPHRQHLTADSPKIFFPVVGHWVNTNTHPHTHRYFLGTDVQEMHTYLTRLLYGDWDDPWLLWPRHY